MKVNALAALLRGERSDGALLPVYGEKTEAQKIRMSSLADIFSEKYGDMPEAGLFSVPGRIELSGNHTDHNRGRVIAGSVDLDIVAVAAPTSDMTVRLKSEGFPEDIVDISSENKPDERAFGSSAALIAGVCEGFRQRGYGVGGFCACTVSDVPKGSGLSSSAAFEIMVGNILNHLYNGGKISPVELAQIAQYSENVFFGKPCGLMDQLACAYGGVIAIDFSEPEKPEIECLDFAPVNEKYSICVTHTGGSHADLTDDYAAVPAEMKAVAACFGKEVLRETDEARVLSSIPELRKKVGDRAILRALHFFEENRRVELQADALRSGDIKKYLSLVRESGESSFMFLQNAYSPKAPESEGIPLALFLLQKLLPSVGGAYRLQGGGFAGTVQAYVPQKAYPDIEYILKKTFGEKSCDKLSVRRAGAVKLL